MHTLTNSFELAGFVRRPIQCEGIARGPDRLTDVAVIGSVSPQFVAPTPGLDWNPSPIHYWQQPLIAY